MIQQFTISSESFDDSAVCIRTVWRKNGVNSCTYGLPYAYQIHSAYVQIYDSVSDGEICIERDDSCIYAVYLKKDDCLIKIDPQIMWQ